MITEEQKRRFTAFWNRAPIDRACLSLTAWDGAPASRAPVSVDQQWGDLDYREESAVYETTHTRYFAEAFPTIFTNFGPGCFAACVGSNYLFSPHTVWFDSEPYFLKDWENPPALEIDRNSGMYKLVEDFTRRFMTHGDRFFTSITDIGGTYDIIASLRGTENLLYDLIDYPDEVKAFRNELAPLWKSYFNEYASRLIKAQGGMTSWMPIWSDTPYYPLQCDFCAMISPQMFGEFILPDLREQTEYLDRSIYHLDGIGELPHLDQLLSLPQLNAIQWTSGDGKPAVTDPCWFELYHRIQAAGKGLILLSANPDELETLFKGVSQKGMFITARVRDEQDAVAIVKMAERLNRN